MLNMDQAGLYQLEALCTQEQPPACMSACPLHVDGRSLCAAVSKGDFDNGLAAYCKTVPFPGILSKTCSQPCRSFCKRAETGDALSMNLLEDAVFRYGTLKKKRAFLPRRTEHAAVVGGGISGLSAALELAKKGCKVTVYEKEKEIGGQLLTLGLEPELLEKDFACLGSFPITIKTEQEVEDPGILTQSYDAVYVAWGPGHESTLTSHPDTFEAGLEKIFAGGCGIRREAFDVVYAISDGKRAAISMDRYMKKVHMTIGREKEGTYETTLHVNMEEALPSYTKGTGPYTKEEAMEEARRCLDCKCLECVKACSFLREYKTFPRKYVREVYNNLSMALGNKHANRMINSCNLCGQCGSLCPFGLDVGKFTREAREVMVDHGKMPISSFDFGLMDLEHANSGELSLLRHQPGTDCSRYLFFPGCQIGASAPELVIRTYEDLCRRLEGGVGLYLGCCSIVALWAGETGLFRENIEKMRENWCSMGKPVVITACPSCYKIWKEQIPEAQVEGIWSYFYKEEAFASLVKEHSCTKEKAITVMDACGARNFSSIHEEIRALLQQMGYTFAPHKYEKEQSGCCGFGGLAPVSNQKLARQMAEEQVADKEKYYLTYCMNCRDRYTKSGAESVHLLELFYGQGKEADHLPPTWSDRQKRRRWLIGTLLQEIWKEKTEGKEDMIFYYTDTIKEQLEERMILEDDLAEIIAHAEETQEKIIDTVKDCFIASRRIGNVYFWVYYRPKEEGYEILCAYSHRMVFR